MAKVTRSRSEVSTSIVWLFVCLFVCCCYCGCLKRREGGKKCKKWSSVSTGEEQEGIKEVE
jgi:hypothetical protein